MDIISKVYKLEKTEEMSLSSMFETFSWILGEEPFLMLDRSNPENAIEMDEVGKTCMQHDFVMKPKRNRVDVKVMTSEGQFNFTVKSQKYVTVSDFVEAVNNIMSKALDVINNDIMVTKIFLDKNSIVVFTCN